MKTTRIATRNSAHRYYNLLNIFLFSIIAVLSFIYTLYYTDLLYTFHERIAHPLPYYLVVVVSFDMFCVWLLKLNSIINRHYPFELAGVFQTILLFLLVALLLLVYNYLIYVFPRILLDIEHPFHIGKENYAHFGFWGLIEISILCLVMLNQSARHTIRLYRQIKELKQSQAMAEFRALQTQLNPHFLFNSLNTLLSEIDYNPSNAKQFTRRLADVYRYILQTQDKKTVYLNEELNFIKSYIFLQQVRIGDSLSYHLDYPADGNTENFNEKRIPPLALQLLVENAIKHNVINKKNPMCIEISVAEDWESISVKNQLKLKKNVHSTGEGLKNLEERYRLLANKNIQIEKRNNVFSVKIPLLDGYFE